MKNNRKLDIALNVGIVVLTLVLLVIAAIVLTSCTFEDPNSNSRNLNTHTSFDKLEGIGSWFSDTPANYVYIKERKAIALAEREVRLEAEQKAVKTNG